ncbi:helix-turn-helix domain-containing protein [Corynebacterium lizhenjunii]|uniref:Helix-turn-helix domain-containing protein n=1 Tax=Corynebacterium lizhenjunii TaxID=2709394 RepID=A0A7T0KFI6_9CORY|nr:helix-turn-helix domain-containing protein [Corynebacterium lizhenjunii]QPK79835.1 helix-turn-helix domain-containing protein [Corynebacterium lizhenjunii]
MGISSRFLGIGAGPLAWREASVAAIVAERKGLIGAHSLAFDSCGAVERAAALLGKQGLAGAVSGLDSAIKTIKNGEEVFTELETAHFNIPRAAKNLGVHPNTVRNRMEELDNAVDFQHADLVLWALWRRLAVREL